MKRLIFSLVVFAIGCSDTSVGALRVIDTSIDPDGGASTPVTTADGGTAIPVSFARDIRPLMNRGDTAPVGCKRCHYPTGDDPQGIELGGLNLSTLGTLRKGGVSSKGNIVIPGDPDGSALVQKLEGIYARGARMPKGRTPWSDEEIGLVRRWISEGAVGADSE